MSNLQDTVLRLTRFWVDEGCRLVPSSDLPLSAGVHHPQLFFGLLGGAPQRLTVLQPVRRPRDGRHGHQPYRLARHLQLTVVLKPAPDDLLSLFLRSLRTIGFQLDLHDVRFAEGRWRSAPLDAWGAGWNVRVDGLGIARMTLVQGAAGASLETISADVTYGVERLVTCLARVPSAYHIDWGADGPVYGVLHRRDENELSRFAFEIADCDALRRRLDDELAEVETCLGADLGGLAYEAAMRATYTLDLLRARRALDRPTHRAHLAALAERIAVAAGAAVEATPAVEAIPAVEATPAAAEIGLEGQVEHDG